MGSFPSGFQKFSLEGLASDRDFTSPHAPTVDGGSVDLRAAPASPNSGDHTTSLMDRSRRLAWVTALHPGRRLILGYVFRTAEYPWVQNWESYPPTRKLARGLEFGTQPFDVPRREAVDNAARERFGASWYRWLPAKSKIQSRFLLFYARSPEGMTQVEDVRVEKGVIVISGAGKSLRLRASLSDEL